MARTPHLSRLSLGVLVLAWSCAACSGNRAGDDDVSHEATSSSTGADGSESESDDGEPAGCPSGSGPGLASVDVQSGTLVDDPLAPLPDDLADVGIYPQAPDLSSVPDTAMLYEPAWPLWSNGSDKHRYMVLPAGTSIDTTDPEAWAFPPGTLLFKTFLYDDGGDGCPRPVETRLMRKKPEGGWDYAVYGWDVAGERAQRLDIAEPTPIAVVGEDGAFDHHVPARIECRACHESSLGEALGVERLQLSTPLHGGGVTQLETLAGQGLLSTAVTGESIEHPDADTHALLGMLHGNCVHCHNGSAGPSSSFDLRHPVALDNIIDRPTESSASAAGIRIVPGSPEDSILFLAFSGETDDPEVKPMPPLGVDVRDRVSIELLRAFIENLD